MPKIVASLFAAISILLSIRSNAASEFQASEDDERIVISSPTLDADVRKKGYVTGVAAGSFLDKKTGFRDAGYGLDIVDWIMEPGSDEAYRDQLKGDLAYLFNNSYHGNIRAYHLRDPKTGQEGPWLAGMTLDPSVVYEAWCHQRGYVCLIEEFGGKPIRAGESFGAAFIVGFFDSIEEMEKVYDRYAGHAGLEVGEQGWKLIRSVTFQKKL